MSFHAAQLENQVLPVRSEEVTRVLEHLGLPTGPLSHRDIERVTLTIASRPDLFWDLVVGDVSSHRLLFRSASLEVDVLTWGRGQVWEWHDYGASSGAFAVTSGVLLERHRGDDCVALVSGNFGVGQFGAFGPGYVHHIQHGAGAPAVSVHVYSPPRSAPTFP